MSHLLRAFLALFLGACLPGLPVLLAADSAEAEGVEFFTSRIEPLLEKHCYQCHGNGKEKGGLSFYSRAGLLRGGDSGPAVDLEDPAGSLLLEAVNYEGYEMPPSGKLPESERGLLARWVELGAPMPPRSDEIAIHKGVPEVNAETKNHWAFRPLRRPSVPATGGAFQNPIDAFVAAQLRSAGLPANPPADRGVLVRRLYFGLTGLPPTPAEVDAFVNDAAPQAYERLVDRLLDSPHYGEHWARYWLDLVRYAESNSFERDNTKPFVWKYRDYVIRALNEDKPYDRFLIEQLAGDELPAPTPETIIATGYLRLGPWDDEPADPQLALYDELDDIITTTSQGFLGLTLNCARCHDHKLDPLPQADYYRFLSFFHNMKRYGIRFPDSVFERSVRDVSTPAERALFAAELEEYNRQLAEKKAIIAEIEQAVDAQLVGGEKDDFRQESARPDIIRRHIGDLIAREEYSKYSAAHKSWSQLKNNPPKSAAQALCVKEHGPEAPVTRILIRGNPGAEGDAVTPGFPQTLSPPEAVIVPPAHGESSGRRLALANWIASPDNPLTARVMANRLWQWHFGRGLVRSANDFGLQGDRPTHPELLDWLAAEFIDRGWSLKAMHRLILNSDAYKMSSANNDAAYAVDPRNDQLWRFEMRRLRAEEVRDAILAVNGTLNVSTLYGPSVYPAIPAAVLAGQSRPGENWHTSPPEERTRRSVYVHVKRSLPLPLLAAFDAPDPDFTCPVRFATTQPTQALGLLNSEFLSEQAAAFAADLRNRAGAQPANQVALALARALQRTPTSQEVERGVALMKSLQETHQQSADESLQSFCLLALNLNEFLYLD